MFTRRQFMHCGSLVMGAGVMGAGVMGAGLAGHVNAGARTGNVLQPLTAARMRDDKSLNASVPEDACLRIVARTDVPPLAGKAPWHGAPDGGACFACVDGGWIYVSNSELDDNAGGAGALRFSAGGELIDSYRILHGTSSNCAGGATPWNTWLSCEERGDGGLVYECDPFGQRSASVRPALGAFNHEAVAVDLQSGMLYLTEDRADGCLYRFVPQHPRDLSRGVLQVAMSKGRQLDWADLPDPSSRTIPSRYQINNAARFAGGEGIVWHNGTLFFTTKYDNRVWAYNTRIQRLGIAYDAARYAQPVLTGVDNICVGARGELVVAEDGGDMQVVVVPPDANPFALVTLHGQEQSEITGVAWSPDYSRLYFSSQRALKNDAKTGITYELRLSCKCDASACHGCVT